MSCTRQLNSRDLKDRPADVTRSTVQKAVIVITDNPTLFFGHLRQQLSAVTAAWFAQKYVCRPCIRLLLTLVGTLRTLISYGYAHSRSPMQ